uniref:AvrPm3b2/c2 variant C n=1 Tax=Blumeria graminis f. sp. tritici TaxID=62690 RepID=A0A4D6T1D7_BLUGR|nr:AvrPm3b2/c2 variant C [Blumeria graminis f. sp. tritici]
MKISALFSVAALLSQSMTVLGYLFYRCGNDYITERALIDQISMEHKKLTGQGSSADSFPGGRATAEVTFWEPSISNPGTYLDIKVKFDIYRQMLSFEVSSSGKRIPCEGDYGAEIPEEDLEVSDEPYYAN